MLCSWWLLLPSLSLRQGSVCLTCPLRKASLSLALQRICPLQGAGPCPRKGAGSCLGQAGGSNRHADASAHLAAACSKGLSRTFPAAAAAAGLYPGGGLGVESSFAAYHEPVTVTEPAASVSSVRPFPDRRVPASFARFRECF